MMDYPVRGKRHRRTCWALTLTGAILVLTAMAGPDLVQHLGASGKDHHACAVYHWTQGVGTGALACISAAPPPSPAGSLAPDGPPVASDVSTHPTSSRAPPPTA
jgi:hypothetical protein